MTREEFIAAWHRTGERRCAHCPDHLLKVDSAWGYLYVNSHWISQCTGPRGMHWPT